MSRSNSQLQFALNPEHNYQLLQSYNPVITQNSRPIAPTSWSANEIHLQIVRYWDMGLREWDWLEGMYKQGYYYALDQLMKLKSSSAINTNRGKWNYKYY
jgi:hypothetical protein